MKNNTIHYISWEDINCIIYKLSYEIEQNIKPDIIITIVRGGMIPATMLSHKLGIRNVDCLIVRETIDDQINSKKHTPIIEITNEIREKCRGQNVLIVDDIIGSGNTLSIVKSELQKAMPASITSAVCYVNELNWKKHNATSVDMLADYIGSTISGWVVFPWEIF